MKVKGQRQADGKIFGKNIALTPIRAVALAPFQKVHDLQSPSVGG
jgi:hypothetical protein